jgi:uncharacterized protein (DUF4415 family)
MPSDERITRVSLDDLMSKDRPSKTDWAAVDALTDEEIEQAVTDDPDAAPIVDAEWFAKAKLVLPPKQLISLRLDADVIDFFKGEGSRYQTRINAVLRAYMEHAKRAG